MFFLHDLDLTKEICLPEVLPMDDLNVLQSLGVKLTKKKGTYKSCGLDLPSDIHPLGEAPVWADIERCIQEEPWTLMRTWTWSEERLGSLNQTACQLFEKFTTQIWTCLNNKWRTEQGPIKPSGLQDALQCWTLHNIHAQIKSVWCVACNANLTGSIPGRRMPSFADRRALYFPAASEDLAGYWKVLGTAPGYIADYRNACAKLTMDEIEELDSDLGTLLSECECLPQSTRTSETTSGTQQVIWKGKNQKIHILTNPLFYKLRHISNSTHRRSAIRAPPTHTPTKVLQKHLLEQAGISKEVAQRTLNWARSLGKQTYAKENRSGKAKNRRAPPQRKKRPRDTSGEDNKDSSDVSNGGKNSQRVQPKRSCRRIVVSDPDTEDEESLGELDTEDESLDELDTEESDEGEPSSDYNDE